jgi:hypothetical protein
MNRMPETSVVKKIYKWKPFTGRPKSRWEDDVRNDMRRMQIVKWPECIKIAPNGRSLLRRPKLFQSCSA